jgi:hypothetical protein
MEGRMAKQPKKKNNHFVPQSYLRRFRSVSDKQVGFYNLKSGLGREIAPIKSQCARDYFYTKNPKFEDEFGKLEGIQKALFAKVIEDYYVPQAGSPDHSALLSLMMFQAGRTVSSAAQRDHLANEFGKALLRKHLETEGRNDLLEYLPKLNISLPDGVMDSIVQHLAMYPIIGDMEVTLLANDSAQGGNLMCPNHSARWSTPCGRIGVGVGHAATIPRRRFRCHPRPGQG